MDSWDRMTESLSVRKADFYPVSSLRGKRNYKRLLRVERDGSICETVRLDVPESQHRERLICLHYLRHLVRHFIGEDVGVDVLCRDCPWDFSLQLSNGDTLFLEITAIADNQQHFEINKREERFTRWIGEDLIPLHELTKLAALFPDPRLSRIAEDRAQRELKGSDLVPNPLKDARQRIFLSSMFRSAQSLEQQVRSAIARKVAKSHAGKDATVLVLDNRTSAYDLSDYQEAARQLEPTLANVPFPEIWFYTGYCSDDDGNNADFSFAPLKVSPSQAEVLRALPVDSQAVHVW